MDRDYIRIRGTILGVRYKIANVCGIKLDGNGARVRREAEEVRANAAFIAAANPETVQKLVEVINVLFSFSDLDAPPTRKVSDAQKIIEIIDSLNV